MRVCQLPEGLEIASNQGKFLRPAPPLDLPFGLERVLQGRHLLSEHNLHGQTLRSPRAALAGAVFGDSAFEIGCGPRVEGAVTAFEQVDPGHVFFPFGLLLEASPRTLREPQDGGWWLAPDGGSWVVQDGGWRLAPDAGSWLVQDSGWRLAPDAGSWLVQDSGSARCSGRRGLKMALCCTNSHMSF